MLPSPGPLHPIPLKCLVVQHPGAVLQPPPYPKRDDVPKTCRVWCVLGTSLGPVSAGAGRWVTATTRWEPCATILLQAALGPCSRGCSKGEEQSPGHSSQLHTPRTDAVREPVQRVLGTQRQPVLGYCPRGWEQMSSSPPWGPSSSPWDMLGSFRIPLG